jgi:hypothetical protein
MKIAVCRFIVEKSHAEFEHSLIDEFSIKELNFQNDGIARFCVVINIKVDDSFSFREESCQAL